MGPKYLSNLIQETEGRTRSANFKSLQVKRTRFKYGDHSFLRCGLYLWNKLRSLPENQSVSSLGHHSVLGQHVI
jgi:hypothetical protein